MKCLGIFIFTGIIVIVTPSNDANTNLESKFCEFGVYRAYSKEECLQKCQPSSGFIHPLTNILTCFNFATMAVPFFGFANASLLISCQCGITIGPDNFLCKPEILYSQDKIEECSKVCPEYTAYALRQRFSSELLYCAKSSELEILQLGMLVSRVDRYNAESNKTHRVYECKCGAGNERMQLTFTTRKKPKKQVVKNVNDLDFLCTEPVPLTDSSRCLKRCKKLKGYLVNGSEQLICFHKMTTADVISKAKNSCECGHQSFDGNHHKCNPALAFDKIRNHRECEFVCSKHTILRRKNVQGVYENVWCQKDFNKTEIVGEIRWSKGKFYNRDNNSTSYNCICGTTSSREKSSGDKKARKRKERIEKNVSHGAIILQASYVDSESVKISGSEEFAAACSLGKFQVSKKNLCESACKKARGYFAKSQTGDRLICYHYSKVGQRIPTNVISPYSTVVANRTCKCGVIFNKKNKDIKYIESCIPEVKFEMKMDKNGAVVTFEKQRCHIKCHAQTAYIFDIYRKRTLVRCESDEISTKMFEKLDWKSEERINELTRERKTQCECGLTALSLSDITDNENNMTLTSKTHRVTSPENNNISEKVVPDGSSTEDLIGEKSTNPASENEDILNEISQDESYQTLPPLPDDVLSFIENTEEYDCHDIIPIETENDKPIGNDNNIANIYHNEIENHSTQDLTHQTNIINWRYTQNSPHRKQDAGDDSMPNTDINFEGLDFGDEISCLLSNQSQVVTIDDVVKPPYRTNNEYTLPVGDYDIPSVIESALQPKNKRTRY